MIAGCGTLLPTRSMPSRKPAWAPVRLRPRSRRRSSSRRSSAGGREVEWRARCSSRAPKPVHPCCARRRARRCCAVPAMSMCAHGVSPTNSARNSAAVIAPALTPPRFVMSAIVGVELARGSGRSSGSSHTGSSVGRRRPPRSGSTRPRVVAHHPGDLGAEGAQAGAGEGGDVDDGVDRLLGGQHQRVGHHQPALGVGVEHLDRRAAAHGEHVAELHRRARRHVVGAHQVAGDRGRAAERAAARSSPPGSPPAPDMSFFIWACDCVARLEADAAGVVHDPLADQREVAGRAPSGR